MADAISIYLDLSTPQGALVRGLGDRSPVALGPFYQGQLLRLRVFPVIPTGSILSTPYYSSLPLANLDLQAAVGPRAGAQAILAAQYVWTKQTVPDTDGLSGYFYADLDLNTVAMNAAVGTLDSLATYFELLISRAGANFATVSQSSITILAVVKDPGAAASIPVPTASYLTRDECYNLFVMFDNRLRAANAGRSIITVSPDSAHTREGLGIDNDGNPTDLLT
jgi:hypothetical protein